MEQQTKGHKLIYIIVMVFALLFFIWLVFYLGSRSKTSNLKGGMSSIITSYPTAPIVLGNGKIYLKTKDGKNTYAVSEQINLVVYASSDEKSITGYDVVINYDPKKVKFIINNNLLSNFQIFPYDGKGKFMLTGIKNISSNVSSVFVNTALTEIVFQPLVSGNISFLPEFIPGSKKDSNLIDGGNKEVLGKVEGVNLTIK